MRILHLHISLILRFLTVFTLPLFFFRIILLLLPFLPVAARAQSTAPTTAPSKPVFFLQLSDPQFGMFSNNHDYAQETANFQFAIATSTGPSAREVRIDPAIIMPAVDSWLITRTAPTARTSD